MILAAERDRVARQYATGYEDIFAIGVARIAASRWRGDQAEWTTTLVYLDFLAAFPDSHIARKYGAENRRARAPRGGVFSQAPAERSHRRVSAPPRIRPRSQGARPQSRDLRHLTVASLLAAELAALGD